MRRISKETWEQIKTAYVSGIGLRELARNMDISAGTVLARAKRERWTQQIAAAKLIEHPHLAREIAKPHAINAITPLQSIAAVMQERGERHRKRMAGVSERAVDYIETMNGPEILDSVDQIEKLDKVARRTFGLNDDNPYEGFSLNVLNLGGVVSIDTPKP